LATLQKKNYYNLERRTPANHQNTKLNIKGNSHAQQHLDITWIYYSKW